MNRATKLLVAVALLALVPATAVAVLGAAGAVGPPGQGLPDPGPVTRWGIPLFRAVHDTAAALTVGFLVLASVVLPHRSPEQRLLTGAGSRAVLLAAGAASLWAVSAAVVITLTYSDVAGSGPFSADGAQMLEFLLRFDLGRSLGLSAALALVVATGSWLATRTTTAGVLAILSLLALTPLTVTAHGASSHEAAVNLLGLHLIGVTVWVGGLAALAVLYPMLRHGLAQAARRYSAIAGWSYLLVLLSGIGGALLRLSGAAGLDSTYGLLLIAKSAAFLALGAAGWYQRRRIVAGLEKRSEARGFIQLAVLELLLMALTFGLSVALGRTSPFADSAIQTAAESLLGAALPPEPGAAEWFTQWRLDVVWAPVAVLLLGWYLAAVRRTRARGEPWPASRTLAWTAGVLLLLWATNGAPAVYARLLPSMLVTAQVTVGLAAPLLLALGRPLELARRTVSRREDGSLGAGEWGGRIARSRAARAVARPWAAAAVYMAVHGIFYFSPLLAPLVSSNAGRVTSTTAALAAGYLLMHVLLPPPGERGQELSRTKVGAFAALTGFHITAGAWLMFWPDLVGGDWYVLVTDLWNVPALADQSLAGAVLWSAVIPVLMVLAVGGGALTGGPARDRNGASSFYTPHGSATIEHSNVERK